MYNQYCNSIIILFLGVLLTYIFYKNPKVIYHI